MEKGPQGTQLALCHQSSAGQVQGNRVRPAGLSLLLRVSYQTSPSTLTPVPASQQCEGLSCPLRRVMHCLHELHDGKPPEDRNKE